MSALTIHLQRHNPTPTWRFKPQPNPRRWVNTDFRSGWICPGRKKPNSGPTYRTRVTYSVVAATTPKKTSDEPARLSSGT